MPVPLNLNSLFYTGTEETSYHDVILLSDFDKNELKEAQRFIRQYIRRNFKRVFRSLTGNGNDLPKAPRFFTQGSWSYKTILAPEKPPSQQADLDDGLYFPLSYVEEGPPSEMSKLLLNVVEIVLEEIVEEKYWTLSKKNPNCFRLIVAHDKHIDIPIYCMPDQQFEIMVESKAQRLGVLRAADVTEEEIDDDWSLMPTENVLLAHREQGWIKSDPRPVKEWVERHVEWKGEQLRRAIRYLKAWRDHQDWDVDDPKSILLMVALVMAFESKMNRRDDLALLQALKRLPDILKGEVPSPADGETDLAVRMDEKGIREDVCARIERYGRTLEEAIRCGDPSKACELLEKELGPRFPVDVNKVAIDTVHDEPAKRVAAVSLVGTQISG